MKIIKIIPLLFLLASASGCKTGKESNYNISGTFTNGKDQKVIFEKLNPKGIESIDTVSIDANGNFQIDYLPTDQAAFYRIRVNNNSYFNFILLKDEKVNLKGDALNLAFTHQVEGSEESSILKKFNDEISVIYYKNDSLNQAMQQFQSQQDVENYFKTIEAQKMLNLEHFEFIKNFIDQHPTAVASVAAVQKLNPEQELDYFKKVHQGIQSRFPGSGLDLSLQNQINENLQLSAGSLAPEITLPNPFGQMVSLSSFKGKVVLIDFWASWCKPCRAENPNVVRLYNKFHAAGFEILGVSLDKSKEAWEKAIMDDNLTWNHISDLKQWSSSVVPLYKVQSIPLTVLVDRDGKILAKNLRGKALEDKLIEIFNPS